MRHGEDDNPRSRGWNDAGLSAAGIGHTNKAVSHKITFAEIISVDQMRKAGQGWIKKQ